MKGKNKTMLHHRANKMMKFFHKDNPLVFSTPKTIKDYINAHEADSDGNFPIYAVYNVLRKLESSNLLIALPNGGYFTSVYNEEHVNYGSYIFAVEGFKYIHTYFSNAVRPIYVTKPNGDYDNGTGFYFANNNCIVTAKHVIDDMKCIMIYENNRLLKCTAVRMHKFLDLAFLLMEPSDVNYLSCPQRPAEVLDEVITIGYPPIAKFESIEITERVEISNRIKLKASQGVVVGLEKTYDNKEFDYLVLNARVKGGNSGGPVINNMGCVVGIITEMPRSLKGTGYDELGYGLALPCEHLIDLWNKSEVYDYYQCTNNKEGFFINK